jgi:uncharacterized protein CbrC (UPF0167 family)
MCVDIRFTFVASAVSCVAVTHRQRMQYDVTFATAHELHVSFCSCCTRCMSVVPNTSTLE